MLHERSGVCREEQAREVVACWSKAAPQETEQLPAVLQLELRLDCAELGLQLASLAFDGLCHERRVAQRDASDLDPIADDLAMLRDRARVSEDTDRNWEVRGKYTGRAKERRALRALELSADLGDGRLEVNQHACDLGWLAT